MWTQGAPAFHDVPTGGCSATVAMSCLIPKKGMAPKRATQRATLNALPLAPLCARPVQDRPWAPRPIPWRPRTKRGIGEEGARKKWVQGAPAFHDVRTGGCFATVAMSFFVAADAAQLATAPGHPHQCRSYLSDKATGTTESPMATDFLGFCGGLLHVTADPNMGVIKRMNYVWRFTLFCKPPATETRLIRGGANGN